ncbi:carboxypeptidase-like regulatory domain-containing protein [Lutimonas sp.]|uniref:carboxypeptidase-like regulatory domain-containing protein n=1 Tax=Lutimonas sp. TaxID=1872403 RepID=UPI003D9B692F
MRIILSLFTLLFLSEANSQELKSKDHDGSGNSIVLKGQIIDKETNEAISFATLILKKEEIYRVADENGFFEISVKENMMQTASVSISSMGFESRTVLLKELNKKEYLMPRFEQLSEVLVTGYKSPAAVLKTAISKKAENHPVEPFNFYRYGKVLINRNDTTELDLELITKDHDEGYLTLHRTTQRVEQIKWNTNNKPEKYQYYSQIQSARESAIRYSNIFHKRKYKIFTLNFVKSVKPEDKNFYIISFQIDRDDWKYTNRPYPTKYSGKVYIDKDSFAILKVIENWETTLSMLDIELYLAKYDNEEERLKNAFETTKKEENICYYSNHMGNGIYYPTKHFNRQYAEIIYKNFKMENAVYERESYFFNFELNEVEEIPYEHYERDKKQTLFNRVDYDEAFWDSFNKLGEENISE